MHRDGVFGAYCDIVPDTVIYFVGGKYFVGILHEKAQDIVFGGSQADRFAVCLYHLCVVVHFNVADCQHGVALVRASEGGVSPELCLYAGADLNGIEGLCHIVVGSDIQTEYFVGVLALCRQKYYREVREFAYFRNGGYAVHDRHHHVKQRKIDVVFVYYINCLSAVIGFKDGVTVGGQIYFQRDDDILFVVAYKNITHIISPHFIIT